jgi:hypothetical protein
MSTDSSILVQVKQQVTIYCIQLWRIGLNPDIDKPTVTYTCTNKDDCEWIDRVTLTCKTKTTLISRILENSVEKDSNDYNLARDNSIRYKAGSMTNPIVFFEMLKKKLLTPTPSYPLPPPRQLPRMPLGMFVPVRYLSQYRTYNDDD